MASACVPDSCFANLTKLVDDLDYYLKSYQAYAEFSGLKIDIYKGWAKSIFKEHVIESLMSKFSTDEEIRVLAIGSGDGKVDYCMIEQLMAHFPRIEYTVVEPARDPLDEFQALVAEKASEISSVKFIWRNETFDEYQRKEASHTSTRYQLIHAVHALYYANDLQEAVTFLQGKLFEGGALLAILLSEEAGIYRVWDRYPKLIEGSPSHNLCSAHLKDIYERSNTPYLFYHQSWPSDISLCFDPSSEKGMGMLDFISHVKNFRQSAPSQLRDDLIGFLRMLNRSDNEDENSAGGYQRDWDSIVMIKGQ